MTAWHKLHKLSYWATLLVRFWGKSPLPNQQPCWWLSVKSCSVIERPLTVVDGLLHFLDFASVGSYSEYAASLWPFIVESYQHLLQGFRERGRREGGREGGRGKEWRKEEEEDRKEGEGGEDCDGKYSHHVKILFSLARTLEMLIN